MAQRILIVHLEAMGAVLRATSILPAVHRRFPGAHVTWVTQAPSDQLLKNNPLIDRVLTTSLNDLLALSALQFDVGYCIDKSLKASGVFQMAKVDSRLGFMVDPRLGVIRPLNPEAEELWELGLSDHKKFFINKKPETQLMIEALQLGPYLQEPYVLVLSDEEEQVSAERRREWLGGKQWIVGINTGSSAVIPYKKLSIEGHRQLIEQMAQRIPSARWVLLGGPEDTDRNQKIAYGLDVVVSPTEAGLRDGLCSVKACDMVVSGDSLGMHMAIALQKWVVAWFGPTCAHEIELYGRGVKVLTSAPCAPCWKRQCARQPMCYDLVNFDQIINGVNKGIQWATSLSKQPLSETFSSASP